MELKSRNYAQIGFYICALSVAFGAMGKHLIEEVISMYYLEVFETAVRYQFFHGLAIAMLALNHRKLNEKYLLYILPLFIISILVFCGTLYLLVFFSIVVGDDYKWLGAITPLGGAGFILGWVLLGVKGFDTYDTAVNQTDTSSKRRHKRHRSSRSKSESPQSSTN
jgi:uncharacterized membrane protein YgdD (TMEM256/DUF423 family)